MKDLLIEHKWRPKNIDDMILLPRIRNIFNDGLKQNVLLYGNYGTGKTTLARILIGQYNKNTPYLELNNSFYTQIETLRTKVDDFCSKVYMGFDLDSEITSDDTKYVYLDEFERSSIQYQDALKAYIEEYSTKNVRFILSTNYINKISKGVKSRFKAINFDCQSQEEEKYLKTEMAKRILKVIAPAEGINISKEEVVKIINKEFPDFRSILIQLEYFKHTGSFELENSNINLRLKYDLYNIVYDKKVTYEDIYHFIFQSFGPDNIDKMISLFERDFVEYILNEHRENINNLFDIAHIITENKKLLDTNTDPIILGMSVIGKIKNILE